MKLKDTSPVIFSSSLIYFKLGRIIPQHDSMTKTIQLKRDEVASNFPGKITIFKEPEFEIKII